MSNLEKLFWWGVVLALIAAPFIVPAIIDVVAA
jgi:hypothetical protein